MQDRSLRAWKSPQGLAWGLPGSIAVNEMKEQKMQMQVKIRSGEQERVISCHHEPVVGSRITYQGRQWLVLSVEFPLNPGMPPSS